MEKINKEEEFIIGYSWNPMQRPMNKNDVFPTKTKKENPIIKQVQKEKKGKRKK